MSKLRHLDSLDIICLLRRTLRFHNIQLAAEKLMTVPLVERQRKGIITQRNANDVTVTGSLS